MVVACRWDSLGARLSAIAGAAGLADLLECDFAFEWPSRGTTIDYPASDLFSREFCDRHLVAAGAPSDGMAVQQMARMTLDEARRVIDERAPSALLFDDPYVRPVFGDDTIEGAVRRFRIGAGGIELSDRAGSIERAVEEHVRGVGLAVHARYGDLVTGQWRRFVAREKFRPRALVEFAIERASPPGAAILVVSDSEEYVIDLAGRRADVVTLHELVPGYGDLDEIERSWADLFALRAVGRILAPSSSAFSGFAAAATGRRPIDVLDEVPRDERMAVLRDATPRVEASPSRFTRGIGAREICYLLDSDTGELDPGERLDLARRARALDPDHPEASTRLAVCAVAVGRFGEAAEAARMAMELGDGARGVHDDPRVDALAGALVVAAAARACRRRVGLPPMEGLVAEIRSLRPYQQPYHDLVRACEHLMRSSALLGTRRRSAARAARRSLIEIGPGGAALDFRPDVWRDLGYSAILAAVERTAFWLGGRLSRPSAADAMDGRFRLVRASANGVPWVACEVEQDPEGDALVVTGGEHRMLAPRAWDGAGGPSDFLMPLGDRMSGAPDPGTPLRRLSAFGFQGPGRGR